MGTGFADDEVAGMFYDSNLEQEYCSYWLILRWLRGGGKWSTLRKWWIVTDDWRCLIIDGISYCWWDIDAKEFWIDIRR